MLKPLYWIEAGLALLICAGALMWHWQPDRQLRLHQGALLHTYEERDWDALQKLVAEEYRDRWEHNKASLVQDSQQVFTHFIFLGVKAENVTSRAEGERGYTEAKILLQGRGSPVAEAAIDRVRALREPFRFTWRKQSWKPWDWVLVEADQPELNLDRVSGAGW